MGIRIHKVIGYGLDDFKGFDKDDRINPDFNYDEYANQSDNADHMQKFKAHFEKEYLRRKEVRNGLDYSFEWSYYFDSKTLGQKPTYNNHIDSVDGSDFFHYHGEYEDSNVLLFSCPLFSDWYRYDDIIDYCERTTTNSGSSDEVVEIEGGIYPYSGSYRKIDDGSVSKGIEVLQHKNYLKESKPSHDELLAKMNEFCLAVIGMTYIEFKKTTNTVIPNIIFEYARFCGMFKDDSEIRRLKPLLYTYWR